MFFSCRCIFLACIIALEMPSFELLKLDPVRPRLLVYFLLLFTWKASHSVKLFKND